MSSDHGSERANGFTTKEMLVRLETIVDRIEQKLDAKADKRDLDAFEIKQVAHEAATNLRLVALESKATSDGAIDKYRRWLIGVGLTLAITVAGLVTELWIAAH